MMAGTRRRWFALALLGAALGIAWVGRGVGLRAAGNWLIDTDPVVAADAAIAMPEAGWAGQIELADLLARGVVSRLAVLEPSPTPADVELRRRGVPPEAPARILRALGVALERIDVVPAGEGGTTEASEALAAWLRRAHVTRAIVVTSADHSHRLRRVLRRTLGADAAAIVLHVPSMDSFRAESWWRDRRTLRAGLVELEKLLLDVMTAPLS